MNQGLDFVGHPLSHLIFVDIDGDGDQDLVAAERFGGGRLYRNDSCGNDLFFTDITAQVGVGGGTLNSEQSHIALSDIDNDGDLDIYITEGWPVGNSGVLYRNDTNSSGINFTDITLQSGIVTPQAARVILFNDFDGDGDSDVYIGSNGSTNIFYLNLGDTNGDSIPNFADVTSASGLLTFGYENGATAGDIDNDGDIDIVVARGSGMKVFRNNWDINGDQIVDFTDVTSTSGIQMSTVAHGVGLGDVDNDGDLDLADASWNADPIKMYSNNGDGTFSNITAQSGIGTMYYGVGTLFSDIDNDGDLDIWMKRFFLNNTNNSNYLKVLLLGEGLNRDAVGAKLRVWQSGMPHTDVNIVAYREVTAGTAFFSSDDHILELGLPAGTYDLEATFMSGIVQTVNEVNTRADN